MSKILLEAGLVIEHNKSEVFHFTRAYNPPNPSIDLSSVRGPILYPKPIWQNLGFFLDQRLTFHYHVHLYATKCLSTLNAMKLLGNSLHSILSLQQNIHSPHCTLWLPTMVFQESTCYQESQRAEENTKKSCPLDNRSFPYLTYKRSQSYCKTYSYLPLFKKTQ